MKRIVVIVFILIYSTGWSQPETVNSITQSIVTNEAQAHLAFLASDEMRGRDTGSPEIAIAGNYIASYFKQLGLKPAPGADGYFQRVGLASGKPPIAATFTLGTHAFSLSDDLIVMGGGNSNVSGDIVFVGYGSPADMEKADVKGKIVVALVGTANDPNIMKAFLTDSPAKVALATSLGARALVEVLALPGVPWTSLVNYFNQPRITLQKGSSIPHLWMKNSDAAAWNTLKEKRTATGSLTIEGARTKTIEARNVAAVVEGTDPVLKNQYLVVSAHYDHVGVSNNGADSIYNGARDNAIGTVGLMLTAKYLAKNRPKRSVLFLALTAEEKGLLGSAWYAEHPLVPMKQTVFNFNCDGAGYNDTNIVTIIGLERTSQEGNIATACEAFGLKAMKDPVPEQNLFERSDNYNFAVKGVPAIDFAPGIKAFDAELMKYYHQPADEVASLDFDYLIKYYRAYVYANALISNDTSMPAWKAGDKFEAAAKELYGK